MKIITRDKAYVQLNDLAVLMKFNEGKSIPSSIINDIFSEVFICTNENRYEFREFSKPEQIKFFKDLDYSVNYLDYKDMSEEDMMKCGDAIANEMNELANKVNALIKAKKGVPEEMYNKHEQLEFKLLSLRDILWFKQGHIKMTLPKIKAEDKPQKKSIFNIFKRR